ncbi:kinase-like domain-containing protein [Fusarium phyllophilum]|uniref:Kinase-like domain-containing protein n=1 Tax=Fusarium phyllophilum TaxID=47803 RepID=A0A8H5J3F4_9HYPO|nr:kinase-like domain-containing protein [Fusarium phyllophilum]
MSSKSRPSTPPHHPNFGVRMSRESVDRLVRHILPDTTHIEVEALPSLKSFNNRIYYLQCHRKSQSSNDATYIDELVLKINGRGFGSEKIQNEVSCLRLLEHFCPEIPTPRALAWSQDGLTIDTKVVQHGEVKLSGADESPSGRILMTRVPGKPINLSTLSDDDKFHLATQLADYVTNWRRNVLPQRFAGNISFHQMGCQPDIEIPSSNTARFLIRGMLGEELFCQDGLPALKTLNTKDDSFVFTHYDLSPRNILVSGQPPQIIGIVDFEFSGFFPPLDEFLNDCIANNGDWPKDMYEAYLKRLESNGISTPLEGIKNDHWEQMALLEELVQKIAPWWLPGIRFAHFGYATVRGLCWGDSTGDSLFSSNPPDPDSEFALEIANGYISRVMFTPSEDLPKTYGSMTSPQDSTTTSTHEDLSPTDNGKLEPAQTSAKKSLEDQIDNLLAILRDIRSFIMPAYPGAGRIVIIISIFLYCRNRSALPVL